MWTRVNPKCMSLNISEVFYLKRVKDTQNLRQQYRKPSRRGFQIISYMYNLNVKQAIANQICFTHYMEYMYIMTPKTTENAKTRQNVYFQMAPKATTLLHTSFQITPMHSVCRDDFFFVENKLTRAYLKWGRGGWIFNFSPFWDPLAFWQDQTGRCTTWLWGLQYKTIIGSHMVFSYWGDAITRFT